MKNHTQVLKCIEHISDDNIKNSEHLALVEILTLGHINPIVNTSWQLLYVAVLQESVQGHLLRALPSCNRCENLNL